MKYNVLDDFYTLVGSVSAN